EKFDAVHIIKLDGKFERTVIKFDPKEEESIADTSWSDDDRLVASKAKHFGYLKQPMLTGAVYASNADGSEQKQLFGYLEDNGNYRSQLKDRATAYLTDLLHGTNGQALFVYVPWDQSRSADKSSVFRVDTHTGKRTQIESFDGGYVSADEAGALRFRIDSTNDDEPINWYRPHGSDTEWVRVPASIAGRSIQPVGFEQDNNHVYALISDSGEPSALYRVDMSAGTRERLAGNAVLNVSGVLWGGYEGKPFAVSYSGGRPKIDYVDPKSEWAQLHSGLMKLFPGQMVSFVNFSKDNQKVLFFVYSDRHPGAYYLFDRVTKQPSLLFESMEWIAPETMASTMPFEYKNSHGDTLQGFLTTPVGKSGPLPMIVMPHGGPFGPYDSWGYEPDVQFLASRGYAVLQVNYRGSGGRGENFERSTYRQWGTGIQDDIGDGVKWVISQGKADANRVCIYGASFGGYSALMNPIRNPGMYKCAIGYAGVYDLAEMQDSGDTNDSTQGRSYLSRAVGSDAAELAAQSPASHADQLNLPILLIHGKADWRAPIEQYNHMEDALKKAKKPFESMLRSNEGHGFYDTTNQIELYKRLEAFLLKYNPPN
ncbi:MAG TPA: prolyl oligopeptidase family serine peptidase, partial [Arenimonas sp.]|uniref:alpha/beta hydrolase family protein n=1 Tax=Arenimonas sp. TaxID=1872635 RepID=UPI002BE89E71